MEKLNIAELLKDCPSGTKLYSTVHGEVELVDIFHKLIRCKLFDGISFVGFHSNVEWIKDVGECILFPSKDQRDWSKFQRPFKDGDIVCNIENAIIIYKKIDVKGYCGSFASLDRNNTFIPHYLAYLEDTCRFATEEEKQKLFDAIKINNYKWNPETKILEKLIKFKVGDRIKQIGSDRYYIIKTIEFDRYILHNNQFLKFTDEHIYELAPNKFDITTLKPFDKVLVRDSFSEPWNINYFSYIDSARMFKTIMGTYLQCIPYEGNEYLLGTFEDCKDYYKTWKEL